MGVACSIALIEADQQISTQRSLQPLTQEHGGLAEGQAGAAVLELLGMRASGLLAAVALPVLLTALLFLGPLAMLGWRLWHGDDARQPRKRPMEVLLEALSSLPTS